MAWNFPLARRAGQFGARARANWLRRHQHPFNFFIHMLGIPIACIGILMLVADGIAATFGFETGLPTWYWSLGAVGVGYLFQFLGHAVEGNDVGELIPIKRALGLKVVPIAPWAMKSDDPVSPT